MLAICIGKGRGVGGRVSQEEVLEPRDMNKVDSGDTRHIRARVSLWAYTGFIYHLRFERLCSMVVYSLNKCGVI